jgi:hypothetical protein
MFTTINTKKNILPMATLRNQSDSIPILTIFLTFIFHIFLSSMTLPFTWPLSTICTSFINHRRVYPKVSGLVAWSENCKWYSSMPLDAVVSIFYESV